MYSTANCHNFIGPSGLFMVEHKQRLDSYGRWRHFYIFANSRILYLSNLPTICMYIVDRILGPNYMWISQYQAFPYMSKLDMATDEWTFYS